MRYNPLYTPIRITYNLSDRSKAIMGKRWCKSYEERRLREQMAWDYYKGVRTGSYIREILENAKAEVISNGRG